MKMPLKIMKKLKKNYKLAKYIIFLLFCCYIIFFNNKKHHNNIIMQYIPFDKKFYNKKFKKQILELISKSLGHIFLEIKPLKNF